MLTIDFLKKQMNFMQKFINYIQQFSSLTENEIEIISKNVYIEKIPAKSFILEAGKVCQRIGFIMDGVIRSYCYDINGNEIIKCFHTQNQFAVDLLSYQKSIPSNDYIQMLTDCEFVFISRISDEYLSNTIGKWPILVRKISDTLLSEKIKNRTILFHEDAKKRYLSFLKEYPEIINKVPLGQIASFLGIAQQSLSRIRKNLVS
jgi:CRP-like cAMP-binding protein